MLVLLYDENFNNEVLSPRIVTITLCGAGIGWRPYPFHRGEGRGPNNNFGNAPAATLAVDEGGETLPQTELPGGGALSSSLLLMRQYCATKSHVVQQPRGHGGNTFRGDVARKCTKYNAAAATVERNFLDWGDYDDNGGRRGRK